MAEGPRLKETRISTSWEGGTVGGFTQVRLKALPWDLVYLGQVKCTPLGLDFTQVRFKMLPWDLISLWLGQVKGAPLGLGFHLGQVKSAPLGLVFHLGQVKSAPLGLAFHLGQVKRLALGQPREQGQVRLIFFKTTPDQHQDTSPTTGLGPCETSIRTAKGARLGKVNFF